VEADQVQPRAWDQRGEVLHEFLRLHDDLGRAVAIRALQSRHDLPLAIAAQSLISERGASDLPAQPFQLLALIRPTEHRGVQAEAVGIGAQPALRRSQTAHRPRAPLRSSSSRWAVSPAEKVSTWSVEACRILSAEPSRYFMS
jgi:hypothetical protein